MESLLVSQGPKKERYALLTHQIEALTNEEPDRTANLANVAAAIKQTFDFHWVGFYIVQHENLVLGPFQGPVACTRISFGKGVCGHAWKEKKTILVPDVDLFPGHIACSALSRSEIVVPVIADGQVVAVLDIDSSLLNDFDETDQQALEDIARHTASFWQAGKE